MRPRRRYSLTFTPAPTLGYRRWTFAVVVGDHEPGTVSVYGDTFYQLARNIRFWRRFDP